MRRLILVAVPIAVLAGLVTGSSHAGVATPTMANAAALLGSSVTSTDKPYTSTTPDSGTCGNNWAIDLFTRQFTVTPAGTGMWTVIEKFNNAKFITLGDGATGSAASPGKCDLGTPANATHMLAEGVSGTFTGTFTLNVTATTFTSAPGCGTPETNVGAATDDGCTTAGWVAAHFSGATYTIPIFRFVYKADVNGHSRTWTNANTGNLGDIYSS